MQIEIAKHYNDHNRLARIEKGIGVLREALELDAQTAMSVLGGEAHDFERERIETGGGEVETPFGRGSVVDVSRLVHTKYGDEHSMMGITNNEVELTDDLLEGMLGGGGPQGV